MGLGSLCSRLAEQTGSFSSHVLHTWQSQKGHPAHKLTSSTYPKGSRLKDYRVPASLSSSAKWSLKRVKNAQICHASFLCWCYDIMQTKRSEIAERLREALSADTLSNTEQLDKKLAQYGDWRSALQNWRLCQLQSSDTKTRTNIKNPARSNLDIAP